MNKKIFDALRAPLSGINLIEASAGTGKTWSLATLFVRLLLGDANNAPLTIDKILVVTFTRAATAELYQRFQDKIMRSLDGLDHACDEDIKALIAPYCGDESHRKFARSHLRNALDQFDRAAIYTIHSFCRRVLSNYVIDKVPLPLSEATIEDDTPLLKSLAADFWRTYVVYDADLAKLVTQYRIDSDSVLKDIRPYIGKPYLQKEAFLPVDLGEAQAALQEAWQVVLLRLNEGAIVFWDYHANLKQNIYRQFTYRTLFEWLDSAAVRTIFAQGKTLLTDEKRKQLARLQPEVLQNSIKKISSSLDPITIACHPFFLAVVQLLASDQIMRNLQQQVIDNLRMHMIDWIDEKLANPINQTQRRVDDLVTDLMRLVKNSDRLAAEITNTWQAALIDEFHDTDPMQYDIFCRSFIKHKKPVFLVGDPKQAIYGFRGADIFTYFLARNHVDHYYTLTKNYRSTPAIVESVNALFGRSKAFLLDIPFLPAQSAIQNGKLTDGYPAIVWHWLAHDGSEMAISIQQAWDSAVQLTVRRIATLLSNKFFIQDDLDERLLTGADIAVLVSTHIQGDAIRDALATYGIASISLTRRSVFKSREANDLLILLNAWCYPGNEYAFHAGLATEIVGLDALAIHQLNDKARTRYQALFFDSHQQWLTNGVMAAWRFYMASDGVVSRILALKDGERRLTNLTHLVELSQQQASKKQLSMRALFGWFRQCMISSSANENHYERLESDEDLVRIVTIHAAKGLQYPIVFCPFLWHTHPDKKTDPFLLYHTDSNAYLAAKVMADEKTIQRAQNEAFAEYIRELYVALTRAKLRIEICWGNVKDIKNSPLTWLLHAKNYSSFEVMQQELVCTTPQLQSELINLIHQYPQLMFLMTSDLLMPVALLENKTQPPAPLLLTPPVVLPAWQVASFSRLTDVFRSNAKNRWLGCETDLVETISKPAKTAFPKGSRAGRCLHDVLEAIDFSQPNHALYPAIDAALLKNGFDPAIWRQAAFDLVSGVLDIPLGNTFSLRSIAKVNRLTEMEFLLPLVPLQVDALKKILTHPDYKLHPAFKEAACSLDFEEVKGYLRGFIDLIVLSDDTFYVVDYKLHYLGEFIQDYEASKLLYTIASEHYYLQYLIYLIAFRAYLRSRALPLAIGGVYYLFLRGLDQQGFGVWFDQPDEKLLLALEVLFFNKISS